MELSIKGALFSFGEYIQTLIFSIYNINEAIIQTQIYFFSPLLNKQAVLGGK